MVRAATPERLCAFSDGVFAVLIMRVRSIATLCLFGVAAIVALKYPLLGLGMCVCCLVVYLKPEAPGAATRISRSPLLSPPVRGR